MGGRNLLGIKHATKRILSPHPEDLDTRFIAPKQVHVLPLRRPPRPHGGVTGHDHRTATRRLVRWPPAAWAGRDTRARSPRSCCTAPSTSATECKELAGGVMRVCACARVGLVCHGGGGRSATHVGGSREVGYLPTYDHRHYQPQTRAHTQTHLRTHPHTNKTASPPWVCHTPHLPTVSRWACMRVGVCISVDACLAPVGSSGWRSRVVLLLFLIRCEISGCFPGLRMVTAVKKSGSPQCSSESFGCHLCVKSSAVISPGEGVGSECFVCHGKGGWGGGGARGGGYWFTRPYAVGPSPSRWPPSPDPLNLAHIGSGPWTC